MEETKRKLASLSEIRTAIDALRTLGRRGVEIDELKKHLEFLFTGYWAQCPIIPSGTLFYRAVPYDERPTHIDKLGYPPAEVVRRNGRVNRISQPVFYCSIAREAPFFELQCRQGTKLALSRWRTTGRLIVQSVGYTESTFARLASARKDLPKPTISATERAAQEEATRALIHEFLSEEFTKEIADGEFEEYNLSIAIAERLLGKIVNTKSDEQMEFAGIMYPTMKMRANADNFALLPSIVDKHVRLEEVEYIRVREVGDLKYEITKLDFANSWKQDGLILWQGGPQSWTSKQVQTVTVENGAWVARDVDGNLVSFQSAQSDEPAPPPISYLAEFANDFPTSLLIGNLVDATEDGGAKLKLYQKMAYDLGAKEKFMAFFILPTPFAFSLMKHVANTQGEVQAQLEEQAKALRLPDHSEEWWKEFTFTRRMIFYCNANLGDDVRRILVEYFSSKDLLFEWRGSDYLLGKFGPQ